MKNILNKMLIGAVLVAGYSPVQAMCKATPAKLVSTAIPKSMSEEEEGSLRALLIKEIMQLIYEGYDLEIKVRMLMLLQGNEFTLGETLKLMIINNIMHPTLLVNKTPAELEEDKAKLLGMISEIREILNKEQQKQSEIRSKL